MRKNSTHSTLKDITKSNADEEEASRGGAGDQTLKSGMKIGEKE